MMADDYFKTLNSFMTEIPIIWTGFYMIETSVMKELITTNIA